MKKKRGYSLLIALSLLFSFCAERPESKSIQQLKFSVKLDSILSSESLKNTKVMQQVKQFKACLTDTQKLSILIDIVHNLPYTSARYVTDEIVTCARKIKFNNALYSAYLSKQYFFANKANKDSANYYYKLVRDWAVSTDNKDFIIQNQLYLALANEMQRDLRQSDSILFNVIDLIKEYNYTNDRFIAVTYYYLGKNKNIEFDNKAALEYLNKAGKHAELSKYDELASEIYFRAGECYLMESDYNNSIDAYGKSMAYAEKAGDEQNIASNLGAIGEIYIYKEDFAKSKNFLFKSLELSKRIGYEYQEAYTNATIGSLFFQDSSYVDALKYFNESNRVYGSFNADHHSYEIVRNNLCIGEVYLAMDSMDKAMYYVKGVCETPEFHDDPGIAAEALNTLGEVYLKQNRLVEAEQACMRSLQLSKDNDLINSVQAIYHLLYKLFEAKKNFERAHYYFKAFTKLSDSLTNKTQIKKFAELENEIKQNELKALHNEKEAKLVSEKLKKEEELQRQQITSIIVAIGFVVILVFAILIYRSLQENKKKTKIISEQKKKVEQQKEIIEEKKKEVMDSIAYAKKIQEAILPSEESIKEIFPESFVFYKPKDIVAGDFYWLGQHESTTLIAAADCTGHGVPGAMVSVVCSNALNRAVKEFKLGDPGEILNKVREIVIDTFEKSGSEVKDGMDISLLAIMNKGGKMESIKWAGANNPLWYISNGQLIEIKADKQPVGKFINNKPFTTQSVPLKKGDTVYLITDGFADQFGGPKGKKFKYKNLKELLIEHNSQAMVHQNARLAQNFEVWKSNLEQVDDVTILGIKI